MLICLLTSFNGLQVEHGHEVSWLSELREVCVLFINLDPGKTLDAPATLSLLHTSFDVIYPCLTKFEGRFFFAKKFTPTCHELDHAGTLNKVFMFDKVWLERQLLVRNDDYLHPICYVGMHFPVYLWSSPCQARG